MKQLNLKSKILFYFYDAFDKPKLLANSIDDFLENVEIFHNYKGDVTENVKEEIRYILKINDYDYLKEFLEYYDIFVNPTIEDFGNRRKRSGLPTKHNSHEITLQTA